MDIYAIIGRRVRAHREKMGWTQEELGSRADLHPSYIGMIERGAKKISLFTLQKLARSLRAPLGDLMGEKPVFYSDSVLVQRITEIVRDRPAEQQEFIFGMAKDLSRFLARSKRR